MSVLCHEIEPKKWKYQKIANVYIAMTMKKLPLEQVE
jgi:hypothetical protein